MKSVTVTLVPGQKFQQEVAARTHTVIADQPTADGGADGGMDPKELMLGALGACTAMTIIMVAPGKKWDVQSVSVTVTIDEETDPADATKKIFVVKEEITVKGSLTQTQLDAIKRTAERCPVYKVFTATNKRTETSVIHAV